MCAAKFGLGRLQTGVDVEQVMIVAHRSILSLFDNTKNVSKVRSHCSQNW